MSEIPTLHKQDGIYVVEVVIDRKRYWATGKTPTDALLRFSENLCREVGLLRHRLTNEKSAPKRPSRPNPRF